MSTPFKHNKQGFQRPAFLENPLDSPLKRLGNKHSSLFKTAGTGDSRSEPFKIDGKTSYSDKDRVGDDEGDKYYRFKLSQKREVKIEVENNESIFGPSLDFRLLDKNGNKIKSVNVDGNDEDDIKRELNKGTYYIKLESNGNSVPYELHYKSESIDNDDDDDD